ncbi:Translation initiation factor 2 subunit alpha [uncultured archaeon]|nr:Translation initiation factor 2 subunit alpha [uncultured archaeon]
MAYQEGDLVLCTVEKIEGTTVFVKLPDNSQGTIVFSEIAPGRIRNIREYVMPNKKIVCKVLRVSSNHMDLSLRRVSAKERTEIMDQFKQEMTSKSALNSILKDKAKEVEDKILQNFSSLSEFFLKARDDEKIVDKYIPKEFVEQLKKITQKRKKGVEIKKVVKMKCLAPDGIKKIKEIFSENDEQIQITYISAGNFQINIKDEDYKKANQKMNDFLAIVEKKGKQNSCEYSIEDK